MADSRLVDEWLEKAEEDYAFAASVLNDSAFYAQICFHFHQAAEKFLKAFIVARDLEFRKIHDLLVLLNLCSRVEPELQAVRQHCKFLNRYYIDTRYPVHLANQVHQGGGAERRERMRACAYSDKRCLVVCCRSSVSPLISCPPSLLPQA